MDYYNLEIPAGKWLSLKVAIDGDGSGGDDLDLYEVNDEDAIVWGSYASQPFERIAWYNPGDEVMTRTVRIEGYNGGDSDYDLVTRVEVPTKEAFAHIAHQRRWHRRRADVEGEEWRRRERGGSAGRVVVNPDLLRP